MEPPVTIAAAEGAWPITTILARVKRVKSLEAWHQEARWALPHLTSLDWVEVPTSVAVAMLGLAKLGALC